MRPLRVLLAGVFPPFVCRPGEDDEDKGVVGSGGLCAERGALHGRREAAAPDDAMRGNNSQGCPKRGTERRNQGGVAVIARMAAACCIGGLL